MKGEVYPGKSDFLLPQTYELKLYLENIKCHQTILVFCNISRQVLDE